MHMPQTIQTNKKVIGRGGDGCLLYSWTEGSRSFETRYVYVKVTDYFIGLVQVVEL